jgi:hypothetical protein
VASSDLKDLMFFGYCSNRDKHVLITQLPAVNTLVAFLSIQDLKKSTIPVSFFQSSRLLLMDSDLRHAFWQGRRVA